MGTPQYLAPEPIVHPGAVDHRADICSLGAIGGLAFGVVATGAQLLSALDVTPETI